MWYGDCAVRGREGVGHKEEGQESRLEGSHEVDCFIGRLDSGCVWEMLEGEGNLLSMRLLHFWVNMEYL